MDHENRDDHFLCSFFFFQYLEGVSSWKACSLLFLKDARTSYVHDNIILFFLCLIESITACAVIFVNVLMCFLFFNTQWVSIDQSVFLRWFENNTCRSCRLLKLRFYCNKWKVGATSGRYSSSFRTIWFLFLFLFFC